MASPADLLRCRDRGVEFVNRLIRSCLTLAAIGVAALSLAACGLKGSLDPPPAATPARQAQVDGKPVTPPPDGDEPATTPPTRKRIFLDWLLD
jgi:predicted small lipoprotein YifL